MPSLGDLFYECGNVLHAVLFPHRETRVRLRRRADFMVREAEAELGHNVRATEFVAVQEVVLLLRDVQTAVVNDGHMEEVVSVLLR